MENPAFGVPATGNLTPSKAPQTQMEQENSEKSSRMELETPPQNMNPSPIQREIVGKQSPAKFVKSSPNKQEFSGFNQPEEHITIIFSSFKDAIRNADAGRLKEILQKYQEKYDLTNRLDPVSKHISTFLASEIKDDQRCFEIMSLLLQYKANAHFVDNMKQSVLFYLAKEGHVKCLELLISKGLNPEDSDIHGQTPLYYAARDGKADCIRLLIQKGADVNHKDNISNQTCLFYAARDGRYEACKIILESGGLASHMDNKKQTPLHWAKRHNKKDVIELLQMYTSVNKHDNKDKNKAKSKTHSQNKPTVYIPETPYIEPSPIEQTVVNPNLSMNTTPKPPISNNTSSFIENSNNMILDEKNSNNNNNNMSNNNNNNSNILKKRKREKYEAKISYKLVYTDDFGKSTELTNADFENFKEKYPHIAEMMLKADSMISENLIKENKEKETWEKVAKKILNNIWKLKGAFYFHSPVDPIRLKIEDYFEIVKRPMDFGTIKIKLNTNVYKQQQEFINDMNLVFTNCVLYNGSESEVGKIGLAIQRDFENMMKIYNFSKFSEENEMLSESKAAADDEKNKPESQYV